MTFYYDGGCGLCSWLVKWLGRMDFANGVDWVACQTLQSPPRGLSWDDLDQAAYLDAGAGDLLPGFYAFREFTLRMFLLWPLVPLFWFPGVHLPGEALYRWVARNRYRLSRCAASGEGQWNSAPPRRDDR